MGYNTYDESASLSSKVELYLFKSDDDLFVRGYTTGEAITVEGVNYVPEVISRPDADEEAGDGASEGMVIQVPFDNDVVLLHVPYLPPRPITVLIRGYERRDVGMELRSVYSGEIEWFEQKGLVAELHCGDGKDPGKRLIPRANHGTTCRHVPYGVACSLNRDDFKTIVNDILTIDSVEMTATEFGATATDDWFQGGYAENPANGEVRFVSYHDKASSTVRLAYPFTGITIATVLNFYAGDDRKEATCRVKFNNKINFLAFDRFPQFNVFVSGVRGGGSTGTGGTGPGNGRLFPV